jgi:MoaA/NifB/PqqE/SkfB family radical SAM enzyme
MIGGNKMIDKIHKNSPVGSPSDLGDLDLNRDSYCIFRLPENNGRALWEITQQCNYPCGYCIFSAEHGVIPGELKTEQVFDTLKELKDQKFSHIKWTGGEPFIRKDIMDILAKTSELGFVFDISTNGSLINEDKAKQLKEFGAKMVHVSLDGHNREIQELARGKNTYSPTIRGIDHLVNAGNYVRIGTVIFKGNENYLRDTIEAVANLGADEIIFSFMEPAGRLKGDKTIISTLPISEAKENLTSLARDYEGRINVNYSFTENPKSSESGFCPAVERFLFIDNLGRISPCTWVVEKFPEYRTIETLKDKTLKQLIQSNEIQSYLKYVSGFGNNGCPMRTR